MDRNYGRIFETFITLSFALPIYFLIEVWKCVPFLINWYFPLLEIPGPGIASWTRFWWLQVLYRHKTASELKELDKEYGPIVRISPNSLLVSDPETTRRVLAAGTVFPRGPWFDTLRLDPDRTNVVSERDQKKHQDMRAILSTGLSGKNIDMEPTIDKHVEKWINIYNVKIALTSGNGPVILDLSHSLPLLALDIITDLCLGESFNCLDKDAEEYGFLKEFQYGLVAQQYLSVLLELKSLLFFIGRIPFLRARIFPNINNKTGLGKVMQIIQEIVERRILHADEKYGVKEDMLDSFLSRGLTLDQAASELLVVLTSAVGSISTSSQNIINCIISNPDVCRRLQNEIDDTVAKEGVGPHDLVEDFALSSMPYLQACISEGLRICPPIFQLREREVPFPGDVLNGYRIPGGTFVGLNTIATQLHSIYGDNPEEFHPERWLITDKEHLKQMNRHLDLVFGYGESKCLGINMAKTELNKIIFEMFRNYKVSYADPTKPWKLGGDFIASDFRVKLELRDNLSHTNGFRTP